MTAIHGRRVLNSIPRGSDWYRIDNQAEVPEVWIYDEIGFFGTTAADFAAELADITAPSMKVRLSSTGGDVFDGIAIYNALRTHPASVTTQVDSMAASIASVIAQAGDTRTMLTGSQMMIHDAHAIAAGSAADLREFADVLEKQNEIIAGVYAERAGDGRKKPHFAALMAKETWLTPTEAVAEGLADTITKPTPSATVATENHTDVVRTNWSDFFQALEI